MRKRNASHPHGSGVGDWVADPSPPSPLRVAGLGVRACSSRRRSSLDSGALGGGGIRILHRARGPQLRA